jgi:hypothetical protein
VPVKATVATRLLVTSIFTHGLQIQEVFKVSDAGVKVVPAIVATGTVIDPGAPHLTKD